MTTPVITAVIAIGFRWRTRYIRWKNEELEQKINARKLVDVDGTICIVI